MVLTKKREIGKRIAQKRVEKHYSQEKFADALNLTRTAIRKIERGETSPKTDTLLAITEILGVSADWIIKGVDTHQCNEAATNKSSELGLLLVKINKLSHEKQAIIFSTMNTLCDGLIGNCSC